MSFHVNIIHINVLPHMLIIDTTVIIIIKKNGHDNYIHSHSKTKVYTAIKMHQLFRDE